MRIEAFNKKFVLQQLNYRLAENKIECMFLE